ncbi:endonuclease VII domain-containing protein [Streptomyces sp. NPDC055085]
MKPHEYEALYRGQNGLCAICERATGKTRRLSVDHDHKCCPGGVSCGWCVRGLLCRPCNDLLGRARDQREFFARAIRYLQTPPAHNILGKKRP